MPWPAEWLSSHSPFDGPGPVQRSAGAFFRVKPMYWADPGRANFGKDRHRRARQGTSVTWKMFSYQRLSQDGSALSDYEEVTLDKLKEMFSDSDFEKIKDLLVQEGLEVEDEKANRYFVVRRS